MPRPPDLQEPQLSPAAQRVVAALSISIAIHLALIGLLRVTPAATPVYTTPPVLQARLEAPVPQPVPLPVTSLTPLLKQTPDTVEPALPSPAPVPAPAALPNPAPQAAPVSPASPALPAATESVSAAPSPGTLPTVNVPLLVDPTFYTAKEVDVHPRALIQIDPVYPLDATRRGIAGNVTLVLKLDETGAVQDVQVSDASPPGVFDQSALDAFHKARFAPAQKAGRAVKSLVVIKVRYELAQ
ncbi:energy transducer TonB [Sulfuriferula sp.]|uniref:energy transducer TonB n=1 Tax=Sulfuriferula sp. TaxID=2025307 RepID=UPI0027315928|nr:energy transducer TonB [Sulfuriferula sp.]MDP2025215.1 energy transducer TonB [Sulfuriferula sp.]